jgi:hypothetical protein
MRLLASVTLAVLGLLSTGCVTEETQRVEGITPGAGNALAANTVMQMVDPWQYGVQDTDLEVPADRGAPPADAGANDSGTSTTSGSTTTN